MMNSLHWLSFVDPALPKGSAFLGVSIVTAASFEDAIGVAWANDINPGGEVMGTELPDDMAQLVPDTYKDRLLTKEDCDSLQAIFDGVVQ